MRSIRQSLILAALSASLLVSTGCITRTVNERVYFEHGVEVKLRSQKNGSETISRGFEHPAYISRQRIARVLGAIEVEVGETDERTRTGIMAYSLLASVSTGLSAALEKADEGQEVVVMAVRKDRRVVALFHKLYLTSFVAYVKDGELAIHLSRVNWDVPKTKEDKLPEPRVNDKSEDFRVVPIRGMRRLGGHAISARFRDPRFSSQIGRRPSDPSKVRSRTILMDSRLPVEELDSELTPEQVESLSPKALQALADLQIARENGEITEDEYRQARDELLGKWR